MSFDFVLIFVVLDVNVIWNFHQLGPGIWSLLILSYELRIGSKTEFWLARGKDILGIETSMKLVLPQVIPA